MHKLQKLPVGIQSFSKLREGGYLYVDKTQSIYKLVDSGSYYFLSRPRRFGKSMLLSTIAALFQGKQELFKDLWIEDQWDWDKQNPVIHVSFSHLDYQGKGLEQALLDLLTAQGAIYNIELVETTIKSRFSELLVKLSQQEGKVVILIDEYDKPLIDYLGKSERHQAFKHQEILKTFYSVLKDSDVHIRFLLITGVSKFSKVGVFSDLNNLRDITLSKQFSTICGYTETEMHHYFTPYLIDEEAHSWEEIKRWYDGYTWDGKNHLYNPFSILSYFADEEFHNYWFKTGTPTFLLKVLKERFYYEFEGFQVGRTAFDSYDLEKLQTAPLLFQTGYLTIKSIDRIFGLYTLGYPNKEVKESMLQYLIGTFSHNDHTLSTPIVIRLHNAFRDGDHTGIINIINGLFKSIPYEIFIPNREAYFHSVIYLVFQYLGQFIKAEVQTSDGRIDAVVETDDVVYIFEFKLDSSASEAIAQIREKAYGSAYLQGGKQVLGFGINFSSEKKGVDGWEVVELGETS